MFIIKLSSDKRVLVRVYVHVIYGTYWQVVCECPEGLCRKKEALQKGTRAALTTLPLSPLYLALNTNGHPHTYDADNVKTGGAGSPVLQGERNVVLDIDFIAPA